MRAQVPARLVARIVVALALAGLATACESSQQTSARLQREGAKRIANQKGLVIAARNRDVAVVRSGVVTDPNGTAAAVVVVNHSSRPLPALPLAITVVGRTGASVFRNDAPGLESSLTSIASLPAHGEVAWVNDQVTPTGAAVAVKAVAGATSGATLHTLPSLRVGAPHLVNDPVSGLEAVGTVTNTSSVLQLKLFVYVSAWRHDKLVSAGRGAIAALAPGKRAEYHVYLIGNPKGAVFTVDAPPTVLR